MIQTSKNVFKKIGHDLFESENTITFKGRECKVYYITSAYTGHSARAVISIKGDVLDITSMVNNTLMIIVAIDKKVKK